MNQYAHSFEVNATLKEVANFHQDPGMLQELTPPLLPIKENTLEPVAEGSIVDFTISFGPIAVNWVSVHKDVDFPNSFTDIQKNGPFEYWEHTHSFRSIDENTTEVIDTIRAKPAQSGINWLISRFMWINLPILFSYRTKQTKKMLEK